MERKIGVIDSGIGGLTVAKALQELLPNEEIVYFGDNKNVPYGNKRKEEIQNLTRDILGFLENRDVKIVALACNTISSVFDEKDDFKFPIVDIISPTIEYLKDLDVDKLGILGTEMTVKSNIYQSLLEKEKYKIVSESSKDLASLVDRGHFDSSVIRESIKRSMENIQKYGDINNLVLACTHYPIVESIFKDIYPHVNYINPSFTQAQAIKDYLNENNLLNPQGKGSIEIMTSGDREIYESVVEKLGIRNVERISRIQLI